MKENNRKSIASIKKLPQFTTMNVIDGQAGLVNYSSLIFYSLTIDNILNIIVLLILAGVSIAMVTGENGILKQAGNANTNTSIAQEKEQIVLAYNGAVLKKTEEGGGAVTAADLKDQFDLNGVTNVTAQDGENGEITITFTDSQRSYTIDANGTITEAGTGSVTPTPPTTAATDGSWSDEKGVNTPVIKEDMELVKWDGSQFVPDDTNSSYSYDGTTNEWANAKVTIEGVESYFVWIPRYEYKITYYTDENKITTSETPTKYGTIDVKFIPITETEENKADDGYTIHPAFTSKKDNGGWSEELPGIWVGKYESSLVNKSNSSNINTSSSTVGNIIVDSSNNTDKAIAVQPNMRSWRYCTIGNMYTNARAYSPSLNSHMLKNSEWGAVAYLTESKYGRNGTEVTINDNRYMTADVDIEANASQSSTGNVTGIYDLSGGAHEYVAAFYNGSTNSNLNKQRRIICKQRRAKYRICNSIYRNNSKFSI